MVIGLIDHGKTALDLTDSHGPGPNNKDMNF